MHPGNPSDEGCKKILQERSFHNYGQGHVCDCNVPARVLMILQLLGLQGAICCIFSAVHERNGVQAAPKDAAVGEAGVVTCLDSAVTAAVHVTVTLTFRDCIFVHL